MVPLYPSNSPSEEYAVVITTLQVWKLRLREVKSFLNAALLGSDGAGV